MLFTDKKYSHGIRNLINPIRRERLRSDTVRNALINASHSRGFTILTMYKAQTIQIQMTKGIATAILETVETITADGIRTGERDVRLHLNARIFRLYRGFEPDKFIHKFARHKYPVKKSIIRKAECWGQYSTLG